MILLSSFVALSLQESASSLHGDLKSPAMHTFFRLCILLLLSPITGTPSSLALCGQRPMRKRLSAPELQLSLTEGAGENGASPSCSASSSSDASLDLEVDELETPSDSEQLDSGHEFEWEGESRAKGGVGARRS